MPNSNTVSLTIKEDSDALRFTISGRLETATIAQIWDQAVEGLASKPKKAIVDATAIEYCDVNGLSLLMEMNSLQKSAGGKFEILNFPRAFNHLLELFEPDDFIRVKTTSPPREGIAVEIGKATVGVWEDFYSSISFRGELVASLFAAAMNPKKIRWKDVWQVAEKAGVNAVPIVALVGFLLGLILAFQSGTFMKDYGAELFVANLVSISMVRELGPLMAAIILAGRTGSAFAAEIGTMQVNEEIDALKTMGINPLRFLVVPRVIAAVMMMPFLAIISNFCGIIGGGVVVLSFGYPLRTYINQVFINEFALAPLDIYTGLFKALIFGYLVAQIGCLRGLQTKTGATAVGDSATSAVVTGIVLIAIWDSIFSVIFYYMGI